MPNSLTISLRNDSDTADVWAYITGTALQENAGSRIFITANGGIYYPSNAPAVGSPLAQDCAIPIGPPGSTRNVTIPHMAGGRIWFSRHEKLQFLLNPGGPNGASLVEPSVLNPSDLNADVDFCFAEFTLNDFQLYANISYVDFAGRLPIALTLETAGGAVRHVSGMAANGLSRLCDGLYQQAARDGRPWDRLIVNKRDGSGPLRVLNPTHSDATGANFAGYWEPYVEEVWNWLRNGGRILIDTQTQEWGIVAGSVDGSNRLIIQGEAFEKPTSADIWGANSGPFTTGSSALRNTIIPRLSAAFYRSCIPSDAVNPCHVEHYYKREPTSHYSRLLHEINLDTLGYGFAYDDVTESGGVNQSGCVNAGDPTVFVVSVGGQTAYAGGSLPGAPQVPAPAPAPTPSPAHEPTPAPAPTPAPLPAPIPVEPGMVCYITPAYAGQTLVYRKL